MVVYIAIKPESEGTIVGGGEGTQKKNQNQKKKNPDTKPLDPSLIENRARAADWCSIVKANKH